jgi:amino acid transporter
MTETPALPSANNKLARAIGRWDLVAMVLNSVIGAGIFGLPSRAFALSGVYSLLAFGICAGLAFLFIVCFAEVGSRFSGTGGPYLYARAAFGRFAGFEMGWLLWLTRVTAFGSLTNLLIGYLSIFWPAAAAGWARAAVITGLIIFLTAINLVGVRSSALFINIFTIAKMMVLVTFIAVGFFFISPAAYSLAKVPTYGQMSQTVLLLVFAFTGFEAAVIPAGEIINPQKRMPFALLTGTAIIAVLYILIQTVAIGTLPTLAESNRPIADAAARMLGSGAAAFVAAGAVISTAGTLNSMFLSAPRIVYAMAEDRHLPRAFASVHRRFRTPQIAILATGVVMYVLTLSGSFVGLAAISTIIRLLAYGATCAALIALRRRSDAPPALFTAPLGIPIAAGAIGLTILLLSTSLLSTATARTELKISGIAAAAGIAYYLAALGARRFSAAGAKRVVKV